MFMQILNTISSSRIWTRHGLKITYAISCLLVLGSVTSVVWNIRTQSQVKKANYAEQTIAHINKRAKESYRVNDIVRANLFGNPNPAPVARVAPKTTLDLTLQGVLAATDNAIARAIIMSGKRNSKLYSIGESIQGAGVSIEEIKANEVLLNRNGAIESLSLVKSKASAKGNNSIITYSDNSSSQISQPELQAAAVRPSEIKRSSPRSENGQRRKIKKPNFSGLDRALEKMGEI